MMIKRKKISAQLAERRRNDSGVAAVELALIIPLLFTILFGVITYGYILSMQQAITQSATEGARAAAITPASETTTVRASKARNAINNVIGAYDATCDDGATVCEITIAACSNDVSRQCATIKVSYNWAANPKVPTFPLLPVPEKIERVSIIEVS